MQNSAPDMNDEELLFHYLEGLMTNEEKQSLENRLLDEPFLQESLLLMRLTYLRPNEKIIFSEKSLLMYPAIAGKSEFSPSQNIWKVACLMLLPISVFLLLYVLRPLPKIAQNDTTSLIVINDETGNRMETNEKSEDPTGENEKKSTPPAQKAKENSIPKPTPAPKTIKLKKAVLVDNARYPVLWAMAPPVIHSEHEERKAQSENLPETSVGNNLSAAASIPQTLPLRHIAEVPAHTLLPNMPYRNLDDHTSPQTPLTTSFGTRISQHLMDKLSGETDQNIFYAAGIQKVELTVLLPPKITKAIHKVKAVRKLI